MTLEFEKMKLQIIRFDLTSPVLYFGDGYKNELRIEQEFLVELNKERVHVYRDTEGKSPLYAHGVIELLSLLGATITRAIANEDGSLQITFDGIGKINVPFHPDYEAWTYASPEGTLVSLPGGGLG